MASKQSSKGSINYGLVLDEESCLKFPGLELQPIFEMLRDAGLSEMITAQSGLYKEAVQEFYDAAQVLDGDIISSNLWGSPQCEVIFTPARLSQLLILPNTGIENMKDYGMEFAEQVWQQITDGTVSYHNSFAKNLLKPEYRVLADIVAKIIEGRAGSFDKVTKLRFQLMTAIIKRDNVNWSRFLFSRLVEEVNKKSGSKNFGILISHLLTASGADVSGSAYEDLHFQRFLGSQTLKMAFPHLAPKGAAEAPKKKKAAPKQSPAKNPAESSVRKVVQKKSKSSPPTKIPEERMMDAADSSGSEEILPIITKKKRTTVGKPYFPTRKAAAVRTLILQDESDEEDQLPLTQILRPATFVSEAIPITTAEIVPAEKEKVESQSLPVIDIEDSEEEYGLQVSDVFYPDSPQTPPEPADWLSYFPKPSSPMHITTTLPFKPRHYTPAQVAEIRKQEAAYHSKHGHAKPGWPSDFDLHKSGVANIRDEGYAYSRVDPVKKGKGALVYPAAAQEVQLKHRLTTMIKGFHKEIRKQTEPKITKYVHRYNVWRTNRLSWSLEQLQTWKAGPKLEKSVLKWLDTDDIPALLMFEGAEKRGITRERRAAVLDYYIKLEADLNTGKFPDPLLNNVLFNYVELYLRTELEFPGECSKYNELPKCIVSKPEHSAQTTEQLLQASEEQAHQVAVARKAREWQEAQQLDLYLSTISTDISNLWKRETWTVGITGGFFANQWQQTFQIMKQKSQLITQIPRHILFSDQTYKLMDKSIVPYSSSISLSSSQPAAPIIEFPDEVPSHDQPDSSFGAWTPQAHQRPQTSSQTFRTDLMQMIKEEVKTEVQQLAVSLQQDIAEVKKENAEGLQTVMTRSDDKFDTIQKQLSVLMTQLLPKPLPADDKKGEEKARKGEEEARKERKERKKKKKEEKKRKAAEEAEAAERKKKRKEEKKRKAAEAAAAEEQQQSKKQKTT